MKIVVINGSPKGKGSNTNKMVDSFLKGAQAAGAETTNIFLSEKEIKHCKGCHTCWTKGPGQCVTKDDMLEVISCMGGANIIVFASPVYFGNISGMLKTFMDRMTMIGNPHSNKTPGKEEKQPQADAVQGPKLMMISSCGFPDRSEFDVVSLWINRVAQKMHMELIGEIYATQGKYLTNPPENVVKVVDEFLHLMEKAGREIVLEKSLSDETKELMEQINDSFNTGA